MILDGDLDILLTGHNLYGDYSKIYQNNVSTTGQFY